MIWFKPILFVSLFLATYALCGQSITVTTDQGISFGEFTQVSDLAGTVTVSSTGARSASGSIVLLSSSSSYYYAIFTISTDSTTPVTVTMDRPIATLSGSRGGTISLQMEVADPQSPSVSVLSPAEVHIGGELSLGSQADNPPGVYSGDVLITFTVNNQ